MVQTQTLIKELAGKYGNSRECLIPILQGIVEQKNYISDNDIVEVANALDMSAAEIYGTASFYTFLETKKQGKYVIKVCKSIIAVMKGKDEIIKTLQEVLHIKVGETTHDNMFTLLEVNDIGWSDREPSMLINDKVYTDLTPKKVNEILQSYLNN